MFGTSFAYYDRLPKSFCTNDLLCMQAAARHLLEALSHVALLSVFKGHLVRPVAH
jgi:hypothetical protein